MTLSRDCDGCGRQKLCKIQFMDVDGSKYRAYCYCPDGEPHLVEAKR